MQRFRQLVEREMARMPVPGHADDLGHEGNEAQAQERACVQFMIEYPEPEVPGRDDSKIDPSLRDKRVEYPNILNDNEDVQPPPAPTIRLPYRPYRERTGRLQRIDEDEDEDLPNPQRRGRI